MPRSRSLVVLSTLAVLLALLVEAPALANTIVRTDGNDTKGPLDLASARVTHATGASVFRVTTLARFTNKQVNGKRGFFEIDFDTNGDRNPNFFVVVLRRDGKMRGWLFKGNGDVITRKLAAARAPRSSRVTVPLSRIGDPESYDFAAFSAFFAKPCTSSHPCIDSIPNRYPLVRHDLTGPTVTWNPTPPTYSSEESVSVAFHVHFGVKDDQFGSGVDHWTLQRRPIGTTVWKDVKTGTKLKASPLVADVVQGGTYELRVIVVDNQGNKTVARGGPTSVPYDDSNAFFSYTPDPWAASPTTDQFLGASRDGAPGDAVSFDVVSGHEFCILGGPGSDDAAATMTVDGTPQTITEMSGTAARERIHCETPTGTDPIHVVLTVDVGTFVFDGVGIAG